MGLETLEWIGGLKHARRFMAGAWQRGKMRTGRQRDINNRVCTDINRATATECAFAWLSHSRLLGRAASLDGDLTP